MRSHIQHNNIMWYDEGVFLDIRRTLHILNKSHKLVFTIEKGSIRFSIEKGLTACGALGTAFTGFGTLALVATLAWASVATLTDAGTTRTLAVTSTLTGRTTGTVGWGKRERGDTRSHIQHNNIM